MIRWCYVGAGELTLMPSSDGTFAFGFCQKMEWMRRVMEKGRKSYSFPLKLANFDCSIHLLSNLSCFNFGLLFKKKFGLIENTNKKNESVKLSKNISGFRTSCSLLNRCFRSLTSPGISKKFELSKWLFFFQRITAIRNKQKLTAVRGKSGKTSSRRKILALRNRGWTKSIILKCLRRMKDERRKKFSRIQQNRE